MVDVFRIPGKPGVVRINRPSVYTTGSVLDYAKMQVFDLQELALENIFFTHALLERVGNIKHDMLSEIIEQAPGGRDLGLFYVDAGVPLFPFAGPEFWKADYRWNSTVFGCPRTSFDYVASYLLSVRNVNASRNWACFVGMDLIEIPDPMQLASGRRYATSDKIKLAVFTVTTPVARFGILANSTLERHTVRYERVASEEDKVVIKAALDLVKGSIDAATAVEVVPESANTATDGTEDPVVSPDPDSGETA